jgi:hypothetical protein
VLFTVTKTTALASAVAIAVLWGSVASISAMNESLWLDELHSVWCATGTASQVAQRAHLGNQLSPYYWFLWIVGHLFGTAEAIWRAPSLIAWLISIATVACCLSSGRWLGCGCKSNSKNIASGSALWVLTLLALDRTQIFYATEARPYAILALIVFWSWLALAVWSELWFSESASRPSRKWIWWWLTWCGSICLSCWLQPIAILAVVAQGIYLFCLLLGWHAKVRWKQTVFEKAWPCLVATILFAIAMLPAMAEVAAIWDRHSLPSAQLVRSRARFCNCLLLKLWSLR